MNEPEDTIRELRNLIEHLQTPQTIGNGSPFLIVANDHSIKSVEDTLLHPTRKKGHPVFTRSLSFCEYVLEQKGGAARLYVPNQTSLIVVLDHHESAQETSYPGWGQHRATLNLTKSPEWLTWSGANGQKRSQRDFSQFIEDNADEIETPGGAELLDLVRSIRASQNLECTGAITDRGEQSVSGFVLETKTKAGAKGELELPGEIGILVSVYEGGTANTIQARLRFEIVNAKLMLWFELVRVQRFEQKALEAVVKSVEEATDLTAWFGTP